MCLSASINNNNDKVLIIIIMKIKKNMESIQQSVLISFKHHFSVFIQGLAFSKVNFTFNSKYKQGSSQNMFVKSVLKVSFSLQYNWVFNRNRILFYSCFLAQIR
jgi:hypothetical protein